MLRKYHGVSHEDNMQSKKYSFNRILSGQYLSVYKIYAYVYSEPCQKSNMELFAKIVNSWKPLTTSAKKFLLWCLTTFCMQD